MIGRQSISDVPPNYRKRLFGQHGFSQSQIDAVYSDTDGYSEPFFRELGATLVDSLDASNYENATKVYDLNFPLPSEMEHSYSVVVDGGSLEHVFDFPTAIKNCMNLVAPGGHFIGISPANNLCGHGFYQFSPEVFFRIFSEVNGFEMQEAILCEQSLASRWFKVLDPKIAGFRNEFVNSRPVYLIYCAKRLTTCPIFAKATLQSDYEHQRWGAETTKIKPATSNIVRSLPGFLARFLYSCRAARSLAEMGKRDKRTILPTNPDN